MGRHSPTSTASTRLLRRPKPWTRSMASLPALVLAGEASLPTLSAPRTRRPASASARSTTRARSKSWTCTTKPVFADLKSGKSADQMGMHQEGDRTKCNCGGATGSCPCAPGTCGCANCAKNPDEKTTDVTAEQAEMEKVTKGDGKEGTKCNCGGADGKCPCPPGQCTRSGCSKAS